MENKKKSFNYLCRYKVIFQLFIALHLQEQVTVWGGAYLIQ